MNFGKGVADAIEGYKNYIMDNTKVKSYQLTPFVVTFCEAELTPIDIKTFMEMGLKIIRFKMTHITKSDKIKMMEMIKDAVKWCCDKYEVTTWPMTLSIDIPNACIRTGFLSDEINEASICIKEDWILELTSNTKFWNKCNSKLIFIDDPYIIKVIKPGTEVSIRFGRIVMICTEVVDHKTIRCKVLRGDDLRSLEFVCVRGVKHLKPALSKIDLDLIDFAREYKLDIITVNSVRWAPTLNKIRKMFDEQETVPLIMSTICEQEGLDNFDEILQQSDGIILAREFLAQEIMDRNKMIAIQLQIGAKCKRYGKPFYISGNILERTLHTGTITACDLTDITNAVMQGAGFIFRTYKNPANVLKAIEILSDISKMIESMESTDFWRMCDEFKMPVNAAEASIVAAALAAQQLSSKVVIIPTVTGRTARQLSRIVPEAVILTISTNPVVARQLQIQRGIVPIVYDKPPLKDWYEEMLERIHFAINFGLKNGIISYGQNYVELRKGSPTSAFCDSVGIWLVTVEEIKKRKLRVSSNCF